MSGCPLDWGQGRLDAFFAEEVLFAREGLKEIAGRDAGLTALCRRAGECWLKRVAVRATVGTVTNALRANGKLMISILSLSDFFQLIVTGEDCKRSKPFPAPYLRALDLLGAFAGLYHRDAGQCCGWG